MTTRGRSASGSFGAVRLSAIPADPALVDGARTAVGCLAVGAGERVVIVTHAGMEPIAASLLHAARDRGAIVEAVLLTPDDATHEPTVRKLLDRLGDADASFLVGSVDQVPTELRRRIVETGTSRRRHGHMIGVSRAMMEQAMRADYDEVARLTARVVAMLRPGAQIEVRGPGGTELRLQVDPECASFGGSGVLSSPGWTNLPGGEAVAVPAAVEGRLVPDAGIWLPDGTELAASRLELVFERGSVARVEGPAETAARLDAVLDAHAGARRPGQLGLGTNTGVLAPIGALLQDLKLPGAHLALGHTCPELTGALFDSDVEIPLLIRRATVLIDGNAILTSGKYDPVLLA